MGNKTGAKRHTHKYHYIDLGYGNAWACALPNCSHFMPPVAKSHARNDMRVLGKMTLCFGCNNEIHMTPALMTMDQPMCLDCVLAVQEEVRVLNSGEYTPSVNQVNQVKTSKPIDWSFLR